MKNAKSTVFKKGFQLATAATLMMIGQSAMAASVTVRVVDAQTLKPVSNAAVCLGSEQHPGALGAKRTNAKGEVNFDKSPRNDFMLSVSAGGQGSYLQTKTARDFDVIHYIELKSTGPNSHCLSAGTVDISTRVNGLEPTHIRASTDADFEDTRWLPYRNVTRHAIERVSSENLYVQVKRSTVTDEGTIEAVSSARVGDLHW